MLGLLYIECGLLRTRLLPFFSKFNTVWGGKGVPTLLTPIVAKNVFSFSADEDAELTCISCNGEYFERTTEPLFAFSSAISLQVNNATRSLEFPL